jgi:hypothetical protein
MRKPSYSRRWLIFFAVCIVCLLTLPLSGQKLQAVSQSVSMVEDWSMHHVIYPRIGPISRMYAAQNDPRALFNWRRSAPPAPPRFFSRFPPLRAWLAAQEPPAFHRDWSIQLGTAGSVGVGDYPAKFGFNVNATPSCTNDFVVFPVKEDPTTGGPNIVGLNYLYSGTAPANGFCNRALPVFDSGTAAKVYWAYSIIDAATSPPDGAGIPDSPALSLDGTKIAFVNAHSGVQPHFDVLAWKAGDGVNALNAQDTSARKTINAFSAVAPVAGSGTVTDQAYGAAGPPGFQTFPSPFVDYTLDKAYVADNNGNLVRFKNVFCTLAPCVPGTSAAPAIDTTWCPACASPGTVVVGTGSCAGTANSKLTSPVLDFITGNVFVGCSDGKLYGFGSTGTALGSIVVGDGSATGGIVDGPIVDSINGFVYAVSGTGTGANATHGVFVQTTTTMSSTTTIPVGVNGVSLHDPAFNNAYLNGPTSAGSYIYVYGYSGATQATLYGICFSGGVWKVCM